MSILVEIHPDRVDSRKIAQVVQVLKEGGLVIYPTDTVYAVGCDLLNSKAIDKVCRFKKVKAQKFNLSFICSDFAQISFYTKNINSTVFREMKRLLPGPYTFILESNSNVPKIFDFKKREVGVRIPDNAISLEIVRQLGNPLVSVSLSNEDDLTEYYTKPIEIQEVFGKQVDLIVDGGEGGIEPSTVLDGSKGGLELIRQGKGLLN
jgi:tRNA threonylcarbamoyl adenosine modification protein (Sua5/YciO/YrdC/YwlC family)